MFNKIELLHHISDTATKLHTEIYRVRLQLLKFYFCKINKLKIHNRIFFIHWETTGINTVVAAHLTCLPRYRGVWPSQCHCQWQPYSSASKSFPGAPHIVSCELRKTKSSDNGENLKEDCTSRCKKFLWKLWRWQCMESTVSLPHILHTQHTYRSLFLGENGAGGLSPGTSLSK